MPSICVVAKPTPELLDCAKRVLMYLYTTRDLGLRYSRADKRVMSGHSDSDWGIRASISAYVFYLAGAAISYLSKKQPTIAMSSTEAEIYAASLAGLEAVFLRSLCEDLAPQALAGPTEIGVDNSGAINQSEDFVANSRNRHFTRRHLKIRELVEDAIVRLRKVHTDDNPSDIFTKALSRPVFEKHRKAVLNM